MAGALRRRRTRTGIAKEIVPNLVAASLVEATSRTQGAIFDHEIRDSDQHQVLVDELDRAEVARSIASDVRQETVRVVGVYGSWGAGKSHLLDLTIREILRVNQKNQRKVIVCVFRPWLHEIEGDLAPGLVQALSHVEKQFQRNPLLKHQKAYKRVAIALLESIAGVAPSALPGGRVVVAAARVAKAITEVDDHRPPLVSDIQQQMQQLVDAILKAAKKADPASDFRLAIFIDDLDRCSPENLVRMLEWLKVHLLAKNCVYVLALDHVAAARAIVGRYKAYLGEERDLAYGFRYLEKLVEMEYELGIAPKVERMAVRTVYDSAKYERLSDAARDRRGDFPGASSMDALLGMQCLLAPRTMLKVVARFRRSLDLLLSSEALPLRNRLPPSYPFWTLFLVAMYYRLDPDTLDEFARSRGVLHNLMRGAARTPPEDRHTGPPGEFLQFALEFGQSAASSVQMPSPNVMLRLAAIVRENAVPPGVAQA